MAMKKVPTSKVCSCCGKEKPLTAFYRHPAGKYGRREKCKECMGHTSKTKRTDRMSSATDEDDDEQTERCGNCKHLMYADPIGRGICGLNKKPKEAYGKRCKNWSNE